MARAMIYKGSSHLLHDSPRNDEVDSLLLSIKAEPSSPLMETVLDFPDSTSASDPPNLQQDFLSSSTLPNYESSASSSQNSCKSKKSRSSGDLKIVKYPPQNRKLMRFLINNRNQLKGSRLRSRCQAIIKSLTYDCPICYAQFSDRGGLAKHLTFFGHTQRRLICHTCRKVLETPHRLLSHRKSAHRHLDWPNAPYKCEHCPLTYSTKMSLQMHLFHYHDIGNTDKPVKKTSRQTLASDIATSSIRKDRKLRRDQLAGQCSESIAELERTHRETRPGPTFAKSPQVPGGNSSPSISSANAPHAPFVQIHGVPQEVEALLSDYKGSPMRARIIDEPSKLPETVEPGSLRWGRARGRFDAEERTSQESHTKTETKIKTPSKRASLSQKRRTNHTPMTLATRKVTLLKARYNCRECYVPLIRITRPEPDTSPESPSTIEGTSIDLQLKNLEIALKKLEVPHSPPSVDSLGAAAGAMKSKREIYRSSVCRTRFTTKFKLINHYLCFHTNSNEDECGVCRIRCGNSRKLKTHLLLHCVKIIQSKQDRSPIDPKGPCEKYRKKHLCYGCKKRFWLGSCLIKHQELCRLARLHIVKVAEREDDEIVRRTSPRKLEGKTSDMAIATTDSQEKKTCHECKTDSLAAEGGRAATENARCALPLVKRSEQPSMPSGNCWWKNRVPSTSLGHSCSVCNNQFQMAANLAQHKKKFTIKQLSRCETCGTLFPSRSLLWGHQKTAHFSGAPTSKIKCPVCDQRFTKKSYLRAHLLHIHYDEITEGVEEWTQPSVVYEMKCKVCKLVFKNRRRFVEHSLYYLDDDTYSCDICNDRFTGRFRCHFHLKMEHYSKEMQQAYTHHCPLCNEGFIYQTHLHAHMFHVHDVANDAAVNGGHLVNTDDPFVCATCEQRFASITQLDQHQNFYSNDGAYQCDKCERKCRSISILGYHSRISHSTLPDNIYAKCPISSEEISSKTSWISHIKHFHANLTDQPSEFCLENVCTLNELLRESEKSLRIDELSPTAAVTPEENIAELGNGDLAIRELHGTNIEFNCAICDERFTSSVELKSHKFTHETANYGYDDSLNDSHTQLNLSPQGPDFTTETRQPAKIPNTDFSQSLEVTQLPRISPQNSTDVLQSYSTDKDPCNFSITNIYSVGLDEYESLANDPLQSTTAKNNQVNGTVDRSLECKICHFIFSCTKALRKHVINYSNTGDYVCEVCGRRFKWLKFFRSHIGKHYKTKNGVNPMYYCEQCDEGFGSMNSKHIHVAHIHNTHRMTMLADDDVTVVEDGTPVELQENVAAITQGEGKKQTIEVDLTEDEGEEAVNLLPIVKNPVAPLSAAVKPTVAQARVPPTTHHPAQVAPNVCPIVCNICHVEFLDADFLVKHFATAHAIHLPPYKSNTQCDQTVSMNYQNAESLKNHSSYSVNGEIETDASGKYCYCKSCSIQFANEYALLTHLRNVHDNNETVTEKLGNYKSPGINSKVQGQSLAVVSMETSFVNSDKYISNPDSTTLENAISLTKNRSGNVVSSKNKLESGSDRPYRIRGSKNSHNLHVIGLQNKDLVDLTRQRLQMRTSFERSDIP
ncbi:uncharacterized protein LOC135168795 [Diachasmimorpha longicaudata]|uniref:uncharacterized protein LOC135168795 n=1 Tax=Diachasmimorpha longicaudata TaxID=58733 RepID=UPI0030B8AC5B